MVARTHDFLKRDEENATTRRDTDARFGPVLTDITEVENQRKWVDINRKPVRSSDEDSIGEAGFLRRSRRCFIAKTARQWGY
jgi:hypothetical protein